MGVIVQMVAVLYVLYRLPIWLDKIPLVQCLSNWWEYRRWTSCRHEQRDFLGGESDLRQLVCRVCHVVIISDTVEHFDAEQARPDRFEGLRTFLLRWVRPPLREVRAFCGFLGVLTLIGGLALWLSWGQVERALLTCVSQSGTTTEVRP